MEPMKVLHASAQAFDSLSVQFFLFVFHPSPMFLPIIYYRACLTHMTQCGFASCLNKLPLIRTGLQLDLALDSLLENLYVGCFILISFCDHFKRLQPSLETQ